VLVSLFSGLVNKPPKNNFEINQIVTVRLKDMEVGGSIVFLFVCLFYSHRRVIIYNTAVLCLYIHVLLVTDHSFNKYVLISTTIIIIHEFHRDASLETKLQGCYVSRITLEL